MLEHWKQFKSINTQRLRSKNQNTEVQQNQIQNNIASTSQQVSKTSSFSSLLSHAKFNDMTIILNPYYD